MRAFSAVAELLAFDIFRYKHVDFVSCFVFQPLIFFAKFEYTLVRKIGFLMSG